MTATLAHPTTRRVTAALLACALVFYAAQVFAHHPFGDTVDTVLYDGLLVAGALICLARVIANPADRLAWGLAGGGMLAWAAADVYNTLVLAKLDDPPYPSIADAGWLVYYPTSYVAVLLLARRRGARLPAGVWLDGVIAALACAALTSALLFEPILSAAIDGATAAIVTNLAYPVGDLLLVLLVVAVLGLTGWRPGRMWLLFAAGLVVSAIADSWYLADTAKGTYAEGGVLDILWPLSALLLGWAAWQPRRARDLRLEGVRLIAVPVLSSLVALTITFYDHFHRLNSVAVSLATATLVVAVVRMGLAFVANARMLARSRHEAVTDALTGLGNRRALMDEPRALDAQRGHARPLRPRRLQALQRHLRPPRRRRAAPPPGAQAGTVGRRPRQRLPDGRRRVLRPAARSRRRRGRRRGRRARRERARVHDRRLARHRRAGGRGGHRRRGAAARRPADVRAQGRALGRAHERDARRADADPARAPARAARPPQPGRRPGARHRPPRWA